MPDARETLERSAGLQRRFGLLFRAARVPPSIESGSFGLWRVFRQPMPDARYLPLMGWTETTVLLRTTLATLHLPHGGDVVMDDSLRELRRHLPIWRVARGRVLITGLGLGCVVRGLLANPAVTHVDVIELDRGLLQWMAPGIPETPRLSMYAADALTWHIPRGARWDYAWHDICDDGQGGPHLDFLHAQLLARFAPHVGAQGAWGLQRWVKRTWPTFLLGAAA